MVKRNRKKTCFDNAEKPLQANATRGLPDAERHIPLWSAAAGRQRAIRVRCRLRVAPGGGGGSESPDISHLSHKAALHSQAHFLLGK